MSPIQQKQVEKRWSIWFQSRVNVIRANSSPDIWFHIPSSSNPADTSIRSISLTHLDLLHCSHGPQFLLDNPKNWSPKDATLPFGDINLEKRSVSVVAVTVSSVKQEALGKAIDCRTYGSLNKLLRVTGYFLRFKANILAKLRNKLNDFKIGELTVPEIEECKTPRILYDQKFIIGKDNFTKVKNSLNLFYNNIKILRVKTKISGIESFSFDKKFPILLKRDSRFTELIVLNAHAAVFHSCVHSTLIYIRSNHWIVNGPQNIKQLLKRYFICKYVQGKSFSRPEVPSLPEFCVKCNHSFEFFGVDFAGLIYYKSRYKVYKAYDVLLFTCGVTRAANIELTKDPGNE